MSFFDLVLKRTFLGRLPFFKNRVENYLMQDIDHDKVQDVDTLTGAAMFIPRATWEKVGGFDHRYFLFMEDLDLCRMVKKLGSKIVYYPEVKIEHYQKRLSDGSLLKTIRKKVFWLHVASAIKYFFKWR